MKTKYHRHYRGGQGDTKSGNWKEELHQLPEFAGPEQSPEQESVYRSITTMYRE